MVFPSIIEFPILTLTLLLNTRFYYCLHGKSHTITKLQSLLYQFAKSLLLGLHTHTKLQKSLQILLRMNVKKNLCISLDAFIDFE